MNWGLSDELKASFPHVISVERPIVEKNVNYDPHWLAGSTSAEGCFLIQIYRANTKVGAGVKLVFQLTQHARNEELMKSLIKYLDCGNLYKTNEAFEYRVVRFLDIENKIIPLFNKYQIPGEKLKLELIKVDWYYLLYKKLKNPEGIKNKLRVSE